MQTKYWVEKKCFQLFQIETIIAKNPISWKETFETGVVSPSKSRFFEDCSQSSKEMRETFEKKIISMKKLNPI